jgi:hypothetical protein
VFQADFPARAATPARKHRSFSPAGDRERMVGRDEYSDLGENIPGENVHFCGDGFSLEEASTFAARARPPSLLPGITALERRRHS